MRVQIVGLFEKKESVLEAARMLHAAGYTVSDLDLVSREAVRDSPLSSLLRQVHLGRLVERPEGMWPCALKWALIGSLLVEAPVLIWVLLAFDSWGTQVLLGSMLWKFGALFGGIFGAIAGADRGLESQMAHHYEKHLGHGVFALAARVDPRDAPQTRAIFIESVALEVRNVEGTFEVQKEKTAEQEVSERRDNSAAR